MKKYTIIFSILHLTASYAVDSLAFDLRPETVMFEKVTHHLKEGQSPAIVEKTIVGHFYQNQYPLIKAGSQKGGIHLTPFGVLSEMLTLVQSKQYDDLPSLYSTETREEVSSGLKDPDRNEAFIDIMKQMEAIESAMPQAKELSRIKNTYGAWEVFERVYWEYPNDQALNGIRGDYAVKVSVFAFVIAWAEEVLSHEAFSEALFYYITARELYPASYFVEKGILTSTEGILNEKEATINIE